jgi:hypothetical protein
MKTNGNGNMSGFAESANGAETKDIPRIDLGQSYSKQYPQQIGTLGRPLSIKDVARLIGCSAWTVRQKYVPRGLPHLRSGPSGRLTFFENQVVAWVLAQQQQKGGIAR